MQTIDQDHEKCHFKTQQVRHYRSIKDHTNEEKLDKLVWRGIHTGNGVMIVKICGNNSHCDVRIINIKEQPWKSHFARHLFLVKNNSR